jgi:uncharacterized protein
MQDNRIAVTFQYEYHDDKGQWFRAYGNEVCRFTVLCSLCMLIT